MKMNDEMTLADRLSNVMVLTNKDPEARLEAQRAWRGQIIAAHTDNNLAIFWLKDDSLVLAIRTENQTEVYPLSGPKDLAELMNEKPEIVLAVIEMLEKANAPTQAS